MNNSTRATLWINWSCLHLLLLESGRFICALSVDSRWVVESLPAAESHTSVRMELAGIGWWSRFLRRATFGSARRPVSERIAWVHRRAS